MSDYHVSEFPGNEYRNKTVVSQGWDKEVNTVYVPETGETLTVDHSAQDNSDESE